MIIELRVQTVLHAADGRRVRLPAGHKVNYASWNNGNGYRTHQIEASSGGRAHLSRQEVLALGERPKWL